MRWARHIVHVGVVMNVYRILVGKLQGKRPVGRYGHRWEDNIVTCRVVHVTKMTGSSSDDWILLSHFGYAE
jgi:hypothetical protein